MSRISDKTKCIAVCATLSALGVTILWLGAIIDVLDMTAAMFASILVVIPVTEYGKYWPWLTYGVTAALALIILPNKLPAIIYLLVGYYPAVKRRFERLRKIPALIGKFGFFNVVLTVIVIFCHFFLPNVDLSLIPGLGNVWTYVVLYACGNFTFFLYDLMLSRIIVLYILRLRDKLGMKGSALSRKNDYKR